MYFNALERFAGLLVTNFYRTLYRICVFNPRATVRRIVRLFICLAVPVLHAYVFAGPSMAWRANEYFMIDGDTVQPHPIPSTLNGVGSKVHTIRQLVIWRAGQSDQVNRCYANYTKRGTPTRVYCEEIEGASLSGAVWLLKKRNTFGCAAACRPSVPKTVTRFLDG
jgi:hypothetical protein